MKKNFNKNIVIIILITSILNIFYSCSSLKENSVTSPDQTTTTTDSNNSKKNNTQKTHQRGFTKQETSQQKKEREKAVKKMVEKNKQLEKEAKAKKKQEEKERKRKQKEEEKLIRNAAKNEKKRIEQERKQEKQALINNLKHLEQETEPSEDTEQISNQQDTTLIDKDLASLLKEDTSSMEDIIVDVPQEDNTPDILKKTKSKLQSVEENINKDKSNKIVLDSLSAMDKVLYLTQTNNGKTISQQEESSKKKNVIQRTWEEAFPKHVDRDIPYSNIYQEQPKTIMILYPWNRSSYKDAADMLLIATTKEIASKGYYVTSMIATRQMYKMDTSFCSKYIKLHELKTIGETYGVDAVMFTTIYRFDNPYWSTSTKANVHYTLISTKTMDTLFHRIIEFEYDTPLAPKQNKDLSLELDEQQRYDLGVMLQLNIFALRDFPKGPYHKKYNSDRKKFSNKQQMKYKINVRPS